MNMKTLIALITMITTAVFASPRLIPFQGRLTNQDNVAYESGQYTLTFNLYDQAVGSASLWRETHSQVGVINGMVNVFLGSIEPFDDANGDAVVDFTKTLYLGITIDADHNSNSPDPEMVPRQLIIPAFHAKDSEKLAGHDWSAILGTDKNDPSQYKILADRIEDEGIQAGQIASDAVGSDELEDGAVTSVDILDGQVSELDLSQALQNKLSELVTTNSLLSLLDVETDMKYVKLTGTSGAALTKSASGTFTYNLDDFQGDGIDPDQIRAVHVKCYTKALYSTVYARISATFPDGELPDADFTEICGAKGAGGSGEESRINLTAIIPINKNQTSFKMNMTNNNEGYTDHNYTIIGVTQRSYSY